MSGANGENLSTYLNQARKKYGILANGTGLADEADAHTRRDAQFGEMQKAGITEMNVHISRGGLQ